MELLKVKANLKLFIGNSPGPRIPMKNNTQEEAIHIKKKKKQKTGFLSLRTREKLKSEINFKINKVFKIIKEEYNKAIKELCFYKTTDRLFKIMK